MKHGVFFRVVAWLLVCTSLAYTTPALAQTASPAGVVTALTGEATLLHAAAPAQPMPLKFRDDLFSRDLLRTQARSIARVLLGGKAVVTVRALSELTILEEPQQPAAVDLADGKIALYVARSKMKPGEVIKIRTPHAIAAVRGTVFIADVDAKNGTTKFFVGDGGSAEITHTASGATTTLGNGQGLDVTGPLNGQPYPSSLPLAGVIPPPTAQHASPPTGTTNATNQSQLETATVLAQFIALQSGQVTQNGPSTPYTPCQTGCGGSATPPPAPPSGSLVIPPNHTSLANETFSSVTHSASAGDDTLDGSFTLTATGLYTWSGGTQQGTGTTLAQGGMLMTGTGSPTLSRTLQLGDGATASASTFGLTGGGALLFNNGTLVVLNAHTLNLTTGMGFTAVGGTNAVTINSGGTLAVASGATNMIQPLLTNNGTVNIASGTLQLAGGANGTGAVVLANTAGAALDLNNNNATTGSLAGGGASGGNVTLGSGTLTMGDASNTTFAGVVSGTGGLTKQGTGTFTLSGANTYSGLTTVNGGTLRVSGGNALLDTGAVNVAAAGARFNLASSETIGSLTGVAGSAVTLSANTLTTGDASSTTFAGVVSGTGGLTKQGTGTFTLSGANTYSGQTGINAGTLQLGAANVLSTNTTLAVNGGVFDLGANSNTVAGVTLQSGNITGTTGVLTSTTDYAAQSGNISAVLGGTVGLTKSTGGTGTLSGANTYTGLTTINGGTLSVSGGSALLDTGVVNVAAAGATFNLASSETIGSLTGVAGSAVTLNANTLTTGDGSSTTFAGVVSGTGGLTKQGTGTFTLSGANTYTGPTLVNTGTLAVTANNALGTVAGGTTVASGATLDFQGVTYSTAEPVAVNGGALATSTGTSSFAGPITLAATSTVNVTGTQLTLSNAIGDGGSGFGLTKQGTGTLTLSGPNTYTGSTTVNGGTLSVSGGSALVDTGAVNVAVAGATLNLASSETIGSLTGVAGSAVTLNANTLTTGDGSSTTFAGVVSGTGGLTKQGTGTFTLSGANTYSGPTTVNGGTLRVSGGSALVDTGAVNVAAAGATFDLASSETIGSLTGVAGSAVTLSANTLTTGDGSSTTFAGVVSGTGGLTKQGTGTFTLSGANTYTGQTTINAGTLSVSGGSALADTSAVNVAAAGARFNLASSETIGSLTGVAGSAVTLNANTLTTGDASSTIFAGVMSGTGGLTKQGTGTFTLSGADTYSGLTTVNAGTLLLTGGNLSTGSFTVAFGSQLQFGGGIYNLNAGTLLSGAGSVNITAGTVNFNAGTIYRLTGATTVSGGTLAASGDLVGLGASEVFNPAGAMLKVSGGALTTGGSVLNIPAAATLTLSASALAASLTGSVTSNAPLVSVGGTLDPIASALIQASDMATITTIGAGSHLVSVPAGGNLSLIGSLLQMLGTAPIVTVGGDVLNVAGTVTGSPAGLPLLDIRAGTLSVGSGTLVNINGGGSVSAAGPAADVSNTSLTLSGPLVRLTGGSTFTTTAGPLVRITNGSLVADALGIDADTASAFHLTGTLVDATNATVTLRVLGEGGDLDTFTLALNEPFLRLTNSTLTLTGPSADEGGRLPDFDTNGGGVGLVAAGGSTLNLTSGLVRIKVKDVAIPVNLTATDPFVQLTDSTINQTGTTRPLIEVSLRQGGMTGGTATMTGPMLAAANSTLAASGSVLTIQDGTLTSATTTSPFISLDPTTVTTPFSLVRLTADASPGQLVLAGPLLTATGGTIDSHDPKFNTAVGSSAAVGLSPQFVTVGCVVNCIGSGALVLAYVTNSASNSVSVLDTNTNLVVGTIPVGSNPVGVALGVLDSASDKRAYVANLNDNTVSVIDTQSNTVLTTVTTNIGSSPERAAVAPSGNTAYVTNFNSTFLSAINTTTNTATQVDIGTTGALGVAVTADSGRAYVVIGGASPSVKVVDLGSNSVIATISSGLGTSPSEILVTPNGNRAYVTNFGSSTVSVIDTNPAHTIANGFSSNTYNTVIATISGLSGAPQGIAMNPGGSRLYVTEANGNIDYIDPFTNRVAATLSGGSNPTGVAFTPDGSRIVVAATGGNQVGIFDSNPGGSVLRITSGAGLTSTGAAPLLQLNGTNVTAGNSVALVLGSGSSLSLGGSLLDATDTAFTTTNLSNFLSVLDGASVTTSGTSAPLLSFTGTGPGLSTATTDRNFISIGQTFAGTAGPSVTLSGPLLNATQTTLSNGDPTKNTFSFLFVGDSATLTSTGTAPLMSFNNSTVDTAGDILSLRRSTSTSLPSTLTLAGPLFSAANGSSFNTTSLGNVTSACCPGFSISQGALLTSSTTQPLIQLTNSTFNAGPDSQSGGSFFNISDTGGSAGELVAPASVTLAGPLLSATSGNISALFSLFSVGRSSFTSTSPDPLIQLDGTTVILGGIDPIAGVPTRGRVLSLFTSATTPASLVLQGPLFAATNATVSSTDTMFGFFDSSTFTSTTASPLISFSGGSATAGAGALAGLSGGFIVVASGLHLPPTMTLTGPLLSATSATLSNGDPTKNVLSFIFIGDSAQLTSTTAAPLLAFDGSSVNTSGNVLALGRSLSVAAPTKLTLSGPLFSATNSSGFNTTSLGNVTSACCDTFFISQGAQLSSTTALPLIQLTNSTLSAGPDLQSGGDVIGVFDTYTTAPPSDLVAPATVTLSGPLLTATGSTISALFSLLNVTRSSLVSTSTEPLVQFLNTGINLGGTNPITGSPTSGFLLVENSATGGSNAPTTVSLKGPFLQAVNSTLTTSAVGIGVFNGASLASSTAFPFVTLDNTSLTTGAGSGGDFLNVSGLGGSTGTATSSASFNGPLLLVSNGSNVILQRDVIIGSKDPTITGTGSAPFIQVIGGSLTTGPSGAVAGLGNGTKLILAGPLLSVSSTLTAPDGLANISNGGQLTVTGSTDPLVSFSGGSSTVAGNSGSSMFNLRGTATAVDVESGLTLGTDRPIQGPLQSDATRPVLTSLVETSGATVAGQQVMNIDTALLEATAPLLNLKAGSVMSSSQAVINLLQKANLNSTAASMVTLNASTLNVNNGALFNVAGGSKLKTTGDLILLSGGALLDIRNGTILNISGNSFASINGGLLNLGAGGGTLRVTNTLCAGSCTNYSGVQVFLTGGALASNISITNPLKNGASITYGSPSAAAIAISGAGSKLTITGN